MENHSLSLAQLKDVHYPSPVSWWPLAPGWYLLAVAVAIIVVIVGIIMNKYRLKQQRRRNALTQLTDLRLRYNNGTHLRQILPSLSILIRKIALAIEPREEIASLQSTQWLEYLDKATQSSIFTQGNGTLLISGPYQKNPQGQLDDVFQVTEKWIKRCL